MEELYRVRAEQLLRRTLVSTVEAPQEVPAVAPVECEQSRRLAEYPPGHLCPVAEWQVTGGQPCEGLHDVRRHERVLEVECS